VRLHPLVSVRVVGENSVQLADAVRAGRLEAGLVALPIDDEGLEVGAAVAEFEVAYADQLAALPLDPPLYETLAFIRRRNARLSLSSTSLRSPGQLSH